MYYFFRARDKMGKGWNRESMEYISSFFQLSRKSVKRLLKKAVSLGFLQQYEIRGNTLYIKYSSIERVKEMYGPVHASAYISIDELKSVENFKQLIYKIAMFRQQEACAKAISKSCKNSENIYQPLSLERSDLGHGCDWMNKEEGRVFLKGKMRAVGASQSTVASKLGVSRATVNKYCSEIPHVRVWVRRKLRKDPPGFYYCDYKRGKDGKKYKRQYREQPCYYLIDMETFREKSAQISLPTYEDQKDAKEAAFKYLAQIKRPPCRTLKDHLNWIKRPLLEELCHEMCLKFLGKSDLNLIQQLSRPDLEEAIANAAKTLDQEGQDLVLLMAKRAKKNKCPFPPAERLAERYSLELKELMKNSKYEEQMAECRREIEELELEQSRNTSMAAEDCSLESLKDSAVLIATQTDSLVEMAAGVTDASDLSSSAGIKTTSKQTDRCQAHSEQRVIGKSNGVKEATNGGSGSSGGET